MSAWRHEPFYFAPTPKLGGGWIAHKDAPSPPPAPDYTGAARATAEGNIEAARSATQANRVDTFTPYGSLTYGRADPNSPDSWNAHVILNPEAQKALDSQLRFSTQMGELGQQQLGDVQRQGGPDLSSVDQVADQAYSNYTKRLDPQWEARAAQEEAKLRNQGLVPGGEAYDNAMRDFNNARNDAYTQANTAAIGTMPQTYTLAMDQYNQPLNRFNAFRSGTQIQNPNFPNVPQQQTTPGANLSGAVGQQSQYDMGLYNSGVGQANAFNSGLFQLGGAALGAPKGTFSDRRLKSNIERVGTHRLGIGIYEYDIFGERQRGVMADEVQKVLPDAVMTHESGFKMVDYGRL